MILQPFNEYVNMPTSEEEWIADCKEFIENYEFPCVGAWDGFHDHVSTYLKNYYSFKNRYTIANMGLIALRLEISKKNAGNFTVLGCCAAAK